jgi:hypothetical protein
MTGHKVSCPSCQTSLRLEQALPTRAKCPRCSGRFSIDAAGATAPLAEPPANRLPLVIGLILGGGFLFVALGGGLVAVCLLAGRATPEADPEEPPAPVAKTPKQQVAHDPICVLKAGPKKSDGVVAFIPPGKPASDELGTSRPLCSEADLLVSRPEVNDAIDRGVAYLKSRLNNQGQIVGDQYGDRLGCAGLVGLTLLSCGVPAGDDKVAALVTRVRKDGPGCTTTYDLAACIWFLDKLGDPADAELIRKMALRLMAGQGSGGGWDYSCKLLTADLELELVRVLKELTFLPAGVEAPDKKDNGLGKVQSTTPNGAGKLAVVKFQPGSKLVPSGREDNSLTQFAALALWTAQKYGVPAQRSLAMVEARFRQTQGATGIWGYSTPSNWPDSMTCAGLIGLAVGHGLAQPKAAAPAGEDKDLARDPCIARALTYLGNRLPKLQFKHFLKSELTAIQAKLKTATPEERAGLLKRQQELQRMPKVDAHGELYFLWSLERVAVIYDLRTIGGTDWYKWGADILLAMQDASGSWKEQHGSTVDTCFALLFLKQVNVAQDLTKVLQGLGGARDPGAPPGTPTHSLNTSLSEIKDEPDVAPGRVKTRTGYKTPTKT